MLKTDSGIFRVAKILHILLIVFVIALLFTSNLMAENYIDSDHWKYLIPGGRDIHAIAQEDSLIWVGTEKNLVCIDTRNGTSRIYDANDGLPYPSISAIVIDSAGNKWIGTGNPKIFTSGIGLLKFNGETWDIYNTNNSNIPSNNIQALHIDNSGNLWVGGGEVLGISLCKYDGTSWTKYSSAENGLPNRRVYCFKEDNIGNLWIGTAGGLVKYNGSDFELFTPSNSPLTSVHARDIDIYNDQLWIALDNSLMCKQDTVWTAYNYQNSPLPYNSIRLVEIDSRGDVWSGGFNGLNCLSEDEWTRNTSIPENDIWSLFIDHNDNIWAGTHSNDLQHGLVKKESNGWKRYSTTSNGLPTDHLNCVCVDHKQNKWFGTSVGLVKYDGLNWTYYHNQNSGLPYNYIEDIKVDEENDLWISTVATYATNEDPYGALVKFDGTIWDAIDLSNTGLNTTYIASIDIAPNGNIWIGTDGGAACYNGAVWTSFTPWNSELPHYWVYSICPLETEIWFGTYAGLSRLSGYGWENFTPENSVLPHYTVLNIINDEDKIWVGTRGGVTSIDGDHWVTFVSSLSDIWVYDMHVNKGDIWLGTGNGLLRYHEENWIAYNTNNSNILGNKITGIASDSLNNIWRPNGKFVRLKTL